MYSNETSENRKAKAEGKARGNVTVEGREESKVLRRGVGKRTLVGPSFLLSPVLSFVLRSFLPSVA